MKNISQEIFKNVRKNEKMKKRKKKERNGNICIALK